jgi:Zinc-binding dehydrogenase
VEENQKTRSSGRSSSGAKVETVVFGAGPVGLSFIKFAKNLGLGYVACVEVLPEKRQTALALGADEAFAPDAEQLKNLTHIRGKPCDAVIDAVGKEEIINAALPLIKMAGAVCVYGVIDAPAVTIQKHLAPTISISWHINGRRAPGKPRPRPRYAPGFGRGNCARKTLSRRSSRFSIFSKRWKPPGPDRPSKPYSGINYATLSFSPRCRHLQQ